MKKNVLLVDDEVITNLINTKFLEKTDLVGHIDCVSNGEEALHYLEKKVNDHNTLPDVIFLDLNMPIMNGFEFLENIRGSTSLHDLALEVIVLSSSFDPRDRERAFKLGAKDFIEKPLNVPTAQKIIGHTSLEYR